MLREPRDPANPRSMNFDALLSWSTYRRSHRVAHATPAEMKPGTLEADGLRVHYLEAGSCEPVVVFPDTDSELFDSLRSKLACVNRLITFSLSSSGPLPPR